MPADPDDLRFVLAIARTGSLLAAAKAIGVDKATVTRRIDALESALGTRVVERSPRRWTLTIAGNAVAEAAREVEGVLERLVGAVSTDHIDVVRLTAPAFFVKQFLIPELVRFKQGHPRIDLRLVTSNAVLDLGRREADIAVRNVRPERGNLVTRPLGTLGLAAYASRAYLERRGAPLTRDELKTHHLLGYEAKLLFQPELAWLVELGMPVALRVTDTLTLLDGVKAGLGIGVLPCCLGDAETNLLRISVCGRASDDICCVFPEEIRDAPRIRASVTWLADLWQRNTAALEGIGAAPPKKQKTAKQRTSTKGPT